MENFKNDIFETNLSFQIDEKTEVDGEHILGKLKGNFFVPNGVSRNNRFYPRSVWENQLSKKDIQKKISERRMFGTISHEQPINDQAILEGKVSHVVSKLRIDENNQGYGEALILNTPAGQILNTLARSGVKLFTSSRANGTYKGKHEGMPAVNPDTYQLSGFDFVLDPGFLQASPSLGEALDKTIQLLKTGVETPKNEGNDVMDKELVESLVKENGSLKSDLKLSLRESEELKENYQSVLDENTHLKEKLDTLNDQQNIVEAYERLGSPSDVESALDLAKEKILEFKELGTSSEIKEALTLAKEKLEAYSELGTPEDIEEALIKCRDLIGEYRELGTPEAINQVFEHTQRMVNETKTQTAQTRAKELAKELNVSESVVSKLYGKMDESEIIEFVKTLGETNKLSNKYRKVSFNESTNEEEPKKSVMEKSSAQRLFERFS